MFNGQLIHAGVSGAPVLREPTADQVAVESPVDSPEGNFHLEHGETTSRGRGDCGLHSHAPNQIGQSWSPHYQFRLTDEEEEISLAVR